MHAVFNYLVTKQIVMISMFKRHILSAVVALGMAVSGQAQQTEQFSIATLNIDGLPQKILVFNVNAEGPGSPGTVRIGKYLLKKDYDLMFLQEDFNYHEELSIVMEDNYRFDTWASAATSRRWPTGSCLAASTSTTVSGVGSSIERIIKGKTK